MARISLWIALRAIYLGIVPLALLSAGGCSQPAYAPGYAYYPQPAVVQVFQRSPVQQTPVTALVSVLGVRNPDPERHIPYSIAVRMRLENNGSVPVSFDPHSLELVTGMLRPFGPPITRPAYPIELAPGQRQEVTASFPFPRNTSARDMGIQNLRLRWQLRIGQYPVEQTALFERAAYDPYSDNYNVYDTSPNWAP